MIIANYMATHTSLDKVWMVISPQNPLKKKASLAKDYDRLHLVNLAIGENPHLQSCDIEFGMPQPSYTSDTLVYLKEKYPAHEFVLIMGSDNLATLHKWKNYETLISYYEIYVYLRPGAFNNPYPDKKNIRIFEAPMMNLSSTFIRECIKNNKSVQYLVPDKVFEYLNHTNMYR